MIFITYLIVKLTLDTILKECNRIATEQISQEHIRLIKSRLMRLNLEYQSGVIDEETYHKNEAEILKDLNSISEQKKGFN
ncbi:MAG TPA: gas vesicle protein GvpG [Nitrosopumilaceae archaeon]|nr:gas vesicle protein GvpG [Nitrosopumilaceae archaeon]